MKTGHENQSSLNPPNDAFPKCFIYLPPDAGMCFRSWWFLFLGRSSWNFHSRHFLQNNAYYASRVSGRAIAMVLLFASLNRQLFQHSDHGFKI